MLETQNNPKLNKERLSKYGLPLLAVFVLYTILFLRYDFYFISNDDCLLESILSGAFSGYAEAHDVYHLYPLAFLLAGLYRLFSKVCWYGLFLMLAQIGSLYVFLVRLTGNVTKIWPKIAILGIGTISFATIMPEELVLIQYTITAAMMAATVLFLVVTDTRKEEKLTIFLLHRSSYIVWYVLAFALRPQIGLFFLPFLALGCLYKWLWEEEKSEKYGVMIGFAILAILTVGVLISRADWLLIPLGAGVCILSIYALIVNAKGRSRYLAGYLLFGICLLLSMGAVKGLDLLAYSSAEWKDFRQFNQSRTEIYDFGMIPNYEQAIELYEALGISAEEQILLEKYNFILSDRYDMATMKTIEEYQKQYFAYRNSKEYFKEVILKAVNKLLEPTDRTYVLVLVVLYVMLAVGYIWKRRYSALLLPVYLVLIHMLCWCYLIWNNRVIDRVAHGLYLAEMMILLALCVQCAHSRNNTYETVEKKKHNRTGIYAWVLAGVIGFAVLLRIPAGIEALSHSEKSAQVMSEDWDDVQAYCKEHKDSFFLLDTFSFANYTKPIFQTAKERQNYVLCGGWAVKTPNYDRLMEEALGEISVLKVLQQGKRICFLSDSVRDIKWLEEYFGCLENPLMVERIGEITTVEKVYEVYELGRQKRP